MKLLATAVLFLLTSEGIAFAPASSSSRRSFAVSKSSVSAANGNGDMDDESSMTSTSSSSRRNFFERTASTTAAAVLGGIATQGIGSGVLMPPEPANAISGVNKVNAKLKAYGLPPVTKVPDGTTPLLEIYGKGKNRFPLLVTFCYPLTWVVTVPSNDVNGEDGTVQAGEYAKGDTATLYVYKEPGHVNDVTKQPKEFYEKAVIKAISQKGDNMYQNFKLTKFEPAEYNVDGQQYMLVDFKYQLLTGAGFEVDRKGVASITSEGEAVEVLWAASIAARYKKTESQLRDIVASFRCYADGINLSEELYVPQSM